VLFHNKGETTQIQCYSTTKGRQHKFSVTPHRHWFVSLLVCLMVFNATFNNISVRSLPSVLLVEETRGPRENHRPVACHWQHWHWISLTHSVIFNSSNLIIYVFSYPTTTIDFFIASEWVIVV